MHEVPCSQFATCNYLLLYWRTVVSVEPIIIENVIYTVIEKRIRQEL